MNATVTDVSGLLIVVEISDFTIPVPGPEATGTSPLSEAVSIQVQGMAPGVDWDRLRLTVSRETWCVGEEVLQGALSLENAKRLAGQEAKVVVVYFVEERDSWLN